MSRSKRGGKRWLPPCTDRHADDGVDPREFLSRITKSRSHHHDRALCSEVAKLLALVFAGDVGDEELSALDIVRVDPAPDATRLAVVIALNASEADDAAVSAQGVETLRARLVALAPYLRSEIARALQRRRVPDLRFVFVRSDAVRDATESFDSLDEKDDLDDETK